MARKNKIVKYEEGGKITNWDEELARFAAEAGETAKAATGKFISFRGGRISIDGQPVKDNKLSVIVIDWVYENVLYVDSFDPDNPAPPVCFAFGPRDARGFSVEDGMAPHPDAIEPQHEQCYGCEKNVFGSAEKGRGKACSNRVRLACLSGDLLEQPAIENGDVRYVKIPVTSTAGWWNYVRGLRDAFKIPPFAAITELRTEPDEKSQFKVLFRFVDRVPQALLGALLKRRELQIPLTAFPYPKTLVEEAPKPVKTKSDRRPKF